jgi:hypothetical protein
MRLGSTYLSLKDFEWDESSIAVPSRRPDPIGGPFDDLELRIDADQKTIHLRSASRVGHGDGGANRKRVELLKNHFR